MPIVLSSVGFLIAFGCAVIMGFAIQRGATCTVAAMDEAVTSRRFTRLVAMVEASLWVAGGLALAQAFHLLPKMPAAYEASVYTVLGGMLLGLGAYVNRACVFGAIARLGSGDWAYAVTPLGFYVGCVTVDRVFGRAMHHSLEQASPVLHSASWVAGLFALFVPWRLMRPFMARGPGGQRASLPASLRRVASAASWSPHTATTVIGVTFLFMLLLVGAWAYTDALAELAHGMAMSVAAKLLLLAALLGGAALGGWTQGRLRSRRISLPELAKCFSGGVLMGWGSLLIPGGNDGLILVGMPLLRPYAWLAFIAMCVTIGLALAIEKQLLPVPLGKRAA